MQVSGAGQGQNLHLGRINEAYEIAKIYKIVAKALHGQLYPMPLCGICKDETARGAAAGPITYDSK